MHVTQPSEAGVAVVVAQLATDQARRGHDVVIVCPPQGLRTGPLADALKADGVRGSAWLASRSPGLRVPSETVRLAGIVRTEQPELVVLHAAKAGLAGRLAIRGRIPTVVVPHAWSFQAVTGAVARGSLAWERFATRWTDHIVCVSRDELEDGRAAGISGAATVVDNGVDLVRYADRDRAQARLDLGLDDVPTAVCVGRLARQKGQDLLLDVWPDVRAQLPDAQLILVGDGPDGPALRARATEGVRFVGAQADTRPYLAAANVVAMASRWEGGALVVLEAMASARSMVAVDVTGLRRALGGTGTIVAGDDASALSAALAARLSDPDGTSQDAAQARWVAETEHGLDLMLDRWELVLTEVQRSHPTAALASTTLSDSVR